MEQHNQELAEVVERNIESLLQMKKKEENRLGRQEKAARAVTRFAGSLLFVYIHAAIVAAWFAVNLGLLPLPRFDPTFVILAMAASVEAIFLTSLVLITQNRMQLDADRRAELDLQISLLSEHEITRLISLTSAIARHAGVDFSRVPDLSELEKDVRPEQVLDRMEQREAEAGGRATESTAGAEEAREARNEAGK